MAWRWWWRRRRPWPYRRRRWRTIRTRRPRRPLRRRRRRRRVRRRRWGRRRGRRTYYRRRFRKKKRKRKKLVLKQWNPSTIRRCTITGMIPLIVCGHTSAGRNYALRSDDFIPQSQPFGGSFSTTTWNLNVLYDEHLKFHNKWSYPNTQLDLARYLGAYFYFYRDPKTDFIVTYNTVPPFKIDKYSSPMLHPGMLMQRKKRILIPSFETRPKGKRRIRVKIKPPTLFEDKWYTQSDLCSVNLLSLAVSAASFKHPFCPPQTENICITFQVLRDFYYTQMNVTDTKGTDISDKDKAIFDNHLYKFANYYQTVHTLGQLNPTQQPALFSDRQNQGIPEKDSYLSGIGPNKLQTGNNSIYGQPNYNPDIEKLHKIRKWFFKQETTANTIHGQYGHPQNDAVDYHIGKYSPIFLSPYRTNLQFPTAYVDVTYNPLVDKGLGNKMWIQSVTKSDTQFNELNCKCVLQDIPIWAMATGYAEFIESELGLQEEVYSVYIICVICPYTQPKMYSDNNVNMGYVFYDSLFGDGKMPSGTGLVPFYYQSRWYPRLRFQLQVLHDMYICGPFSYKDDLKSTVLTAEYKFRFLWGGNMIPEQVIRNPCKAEGAGSGYTYPDRLPRDLQIADPQTMGPEWAFHTWDWRHGLFGKGALKRVSEKPDYDADYYVLPKKPRFFPPTDGSQGQEKDSDLQEISLPFPFEETLSKSQEEVQTQQQQRDLHLRLAQQQRLGQQLKHLYTQILKTQAGLHINPLLYNHV
nr:MAG: ORF1 [Torque teno virus]